MKKIYIVPTIEKTACMFESFIAASQTGGDSKKDVEPDEAVKPTKPGEEIEIGAKDYNAWSSWDE